MTHSRLVSTLPLTAVLLAVACRTAPLPQPYVIELPAGMTAQQAEVAIVAGILDTHPPADYNPHSELSDEEFNRLIWRSFVGTASGRSWLPESRDGNTIIASVDTRGLYLRVAIERSSDAIAISILDSRNLSQSENRIHRRAIKWLRNLEAHIRREVGRMAVIVGLAA